MSFTEGAIYYADGDTLTTGTFYLGGCLTGSKGEVDFTVPLSKPVRAENVSITSGSLRIRQGGSYIFGNSSNAAAITSTQIAESDAYVTDVGIAVNLLGDYDDGTNNEAVCVSGTMTFKFYDD